MSRLAPCVCVFFVAVVAATSKAVIQTPPARNVTHPWSSTAGDIRLSTLLQAMPTEVPYAADAEISLTYDELDVLLHLFPTHQSDVHTDFRSGAAAAIRERTTGSCYSPDEV